MPTTRQAHHPSGRVVSARMTEDTIARLDMLAARIGRSRGRYLRDAIEEMLPIYEKAYWGHAMKKKEADFVTAEFREIILRTIEESENK